MLSSHSVLSSSLPPHGLQHTRLPCSSLSPRVCSNSCPLSQWCHPTISSSVALFSSCLQSFPASSRSFNQIVCPLLLLPSIFPSIRVFSNESAVHIRSPNYWSFSFSSAPALPVNIQGWFPLGLTGLISLLSKGLSRVFSNSTIRKHQFFGTQPSSWSKSHIHTWLLEKPSFDCAEAY